jgi:hypothetical protein
MTIRATTRQAAVCGEMSPQRARPPAISGATAGTASPAPARARSLAALELRRVQDRLARLERADAFVQVAPAPRSVAAGRTLRVHTASRPPARASLIAAGLFGDSCVAAVFAIASRSPRKSGVTQRFSPGAGCRRGDRDWARSRVHPRARARRPAGGRRRRSFSLEAFAGGPMPVALRARSAARAVARALSQHGRSEAGPRRSQERGLASAVSRASGPEPHTKENQPHAGR